MQKHDSDPLQVLVRGGHCRGGWGQSQLGHSAGPALAPYLLHLGQTVVSGGTKAAPMRAPWFSVCLQRRLRTLVEFSHNPVPCRAQGWQRLVVLTHWGALCPLAALHQYHKSIVPSLPAALWPVTKSWPQGTVLEHPDSGDHMTLWSRKRAQAHSQHLGVSPRIASAEEVSSEKEALLDFLT